MPHTGRSLLVLPIFLVALAPVAAWGQAVSGAITGAVLDASGAVVPRAKVTATNLATGVEFPVSTNEAGYYSVANLIAGRYNLDVTVTGFKPHRQANIDVSIGAVVRLDVQLAVGSTQEAVTVSDVAPLLRADKVTLGGSIGAEEMHNLPTVGRNPTALAKLQPGIIEMPNQEGLPSAGATGRFSFVTNGQRPQVNSFLLDGVDNTEGIGGGAAIVPSVDAMQEFTV